MKLPENTSSTESELPDRLKASQRGESERHAKLSSIVSSIYQPSRTNKNDGDIAKTYQFLVANPIHMRTLIINPFTAGTHSSGFREKFGRPPEPSILVIANLLTAGVQ